MGYVPIKTLAYLTLSQKKAHMFVYKHLQYRSFENTMEKGEIAHNEQFLHFPSVFFWRTLCYFHQI